MDKLGSFVHLHMHSIFSNLDGLIKYDQLVRKLQQYGMGACAITDHGNAFGIVHFQKACKEAGIKPIIGCELYVAPGSRFSRDAEVDKQSFHLVVLAETDQGLKNLYRLISEANKSGFYYRPRVDRQLLSECSEGLIALSACMKGEVPAACLAGSIDLAVERAQWYASVFKNSFYLEIQENGLPEQATVNAAMLEVSRRTRIPLVATNDCHYLEPEDAEAHDALLCINTQKSIDDPGRFRFDSDQLYLRSPEEMIALFGHIPGAIENSVRIANRCNALVPLGTPMMPEFPVADGEDSCRMLEKEAREGLRARGPEILASRPSLSEEQKKEYKHRLDLELKCMCDMGFPGYFLIVADFIRWARENGIPVGPGRGSAAGSLVSYATGITNLDPIANDLLFERFLNPERVSLPDVDVDFCQERRLEVVDYVRTKYGEGRVAQIITFSTLAAKAAVKDVARVLDFTFDESNAITKLMPDSADGKSIDQIVAESSELRKRIADDPRVAKLFRLARRVEGSIRQPSTHAAGVIIAPRDLGEICPLYVDQKTGDAIVGFDMKAAEMAGLVKFDFLGLKNLTSIDRALKFIVRRDPGFDLAKIPLSDHATYKLLSSGKTVGVFQLESHGMQRLLKQLEPSRFSDVVAVCALYRPGPLNSGMVDSFVARRHGREAASYLLPELEPILKDTYGVIVYQEQVMQIAQTLAGYSLGQADLLRRAMGKKKPEEMAKQKETFVSGAVERGVSKENAVRIFDLMAMFAEYGFNKSHSAAYALIAYQTAYLKAHYPVEFMAALMSTDATDPDKLKKEIEECRALGIKVLTPDVNCSVVDFLPENGAIRFGLSGIKGVGESAVVSILAARSQAPFATIGDFVLRVDGQKVNKRVIEALVKSGATDSLCSSRQTVLDSLESMLKAKKKGKAEEPLLPGIVDPASGSGALPVAAANMALELATLGVCVSGHPLDPWMDTLAELKVARSCDLETSSKRFVTVAGLITAVKERKTRADETYAFLTLEDADGSFEVLAWPDTYTGTVRTARESSTPVIVEGVIEKSERGLKVKAKSIRPIA